jgi:two-component system, chemotaxis family, chemotaxis protein CheY
MKILIVEDDSMSREVMLSTFSPMGTCDEAANGAEAVAAFLAAYESGNPYNIVMLDIAMPVMNGQEALVAMRRIEKDRNVPERERIRIIMTSSSKDSQNVQNAFSNQCDGYMAKPIRLASMVTLLNSIGITISSP